MGRGMFTVESCFLVIADQGERPKAREVAAGKEGLVAQSGPGQ